MQRIVPVVLCGGSGTRLWPLSRAGMPKQFLVLNSDLSLFQTAVSRITKICDSSDGVVSRPVVVANSDHRFIVAEQLRELDISDVDLLLEPVGKNTAPALTLAALHAIKHSDDDPVLIVTPSDQYIEDDAEFVSILKKAVKIASSNAIVVLGVNPERPETGFGYFKYELCEAESGLQRVLEFKEKPSKELAEKYLTSGDYAWNSGIFVLKASLWLKLLQVYRNDIYSAVIESWSKRSEKDNTSAPLPAAYGSVPADSIDFAVIEQCAQSDVPIMAFSIKGRWNDLGAWQAIWSVENSDSNANVLKGDVLAFDVSNSYIRSHDRLIAAVGLSNLLVVDTPDALLISDINRSQDVKLVVQKLQAAGRVESDAHRKVSRPWGWYDEVAIGERFKVKRITVKPGASLSLQMHYHRAEHWVVVSGTAEVTRGDEVLILSENESTFIPLGETHRLRNPGVIDLEIIEIQSGSYLGENDIVRFEDKYGRTEA